MKTALVVSALMLARAGYAQQVDLLVFQDMKPGQWIDTPLKTPKGMEKFSKAETYCLTLEEINKNKKINLKQNGCTATILSNTYKETVIDNLCSNDKFGIIMKTKSTFTRESANTWITTTLSFDPAGGSVVISDKTQFLSPQCTIK